ncbi:hypothetical protein IMY05_C2973000500 [Salix suchowensis]|nr:hypothetical protein IMY05_C2973000500 [Salix suchowensis]
MKSSTFSSSSGGEFPDLSSSRWGVIGRWAPMVNNGCPPPPGALTPNGVEVCALPKPDAIGNEEAGAAGEAGWLPPNEKDGLLGTDPLAEENGLAARVLLGGAPKENGADPVADGGAEVLLNEKGPAVLGREPSLLVDGPKENGAAGGLMLFDAPKLNGLLAASAGFTELSGFAGKGFEVEGARTRMGSLLSNFHQTECCLRKISVRLHGFPGGAFLHSHLLFVIHGLGGVEGRAIDEKANGLLDTSLPALPLELKENPLTGATEGVALKLKAGFFSSAIGVPGADEKENAGGAVDTVGAALLLSAGGPKLKRLVLLEVVLPNNDLGASAGAGKVKGGFVAALVSVVVFDAVKGVLLPNRDGVGELSFLSAFDGAGPNENAGALGNGVDDEDAGVDPNKLLAAGAGAGAEFVPPLVVSLLSEGAGAAGAKKGFDAGFDAGAGVEGIAA